MDSYKIGQLIAKKRKELGLTQQGLADQLLVTNKAISKWERGQGVPDISLLKDLASILGITVDELLEGEQDTVVSHHENTVYEFEVTKEHYKNYLKDKYYQQRYQRGAIYLIAGLLIALGIALYQAQFYLKHHVDIIGLLLLLGGIVLALAMYGQYFWKLKTFHHQKISYSLHENGIRYCHPHKEVFYYFNQMKTIYLYQNCFVLEIGKELLWLDKKSYALIESQTHLIQKSTFHDEKVLWRIVLGSAYLFLLDVCMLIGYKVILQRLDFVMIFDGLEIVLWLLLLLCGVIIFVIYHLRLSIGKVFVLMGIGCVVLIGGFYIGQHMATQSTIYSLSPRLSKQLVLKQDKENGNVSYYHYTYLCFARKTDQFSSDLDTPINIKWITNDCLFVTYQDQGSSQVYVATYGSRGNDISYYNVLPSMHGKWKNKNESDPQYQLSIEANTMKITYDKKEEVLDVKDTKQNGTIAVTLYDSQGQARYILAMNENCELNQDYLLKNTGTIEMIDLSRHQQVEMFCVTYKEDEEVQQQIDDQMEKQALKLVEEMKTILNEDASLKQFQDTDRLFQVKTDSQDMFEVVKEVLKTEFQQGQGIQGYTSTQQATKITIPAGTIQDFFVNVESETTLLKRSTGKEQKGGYTPSYRIMQGDGCYLVARITYRVPGNVGLSQLEQPLVKDVSQDSSYYLKREY